MDADGQSPVTIRPMREDDVPAAERLSAQSLHELEVAQQRRPGPAPVLPPAARGAAWAERTRHLLRTDPGGCWVGEDGAGPGGLAGVAVSFNRELTWCLATYAVRPGVQGQGLGKALLAAALEHGRGCLHGMISSSADPRAARRYRLAGFTLHPLMSLTGRIDRTAIPVADATGSSSGLSLGKVREGTAGDVELMDSVDRRTRGAAHGPDHEVLLRSARLLVSDTTTGSGYAYLDERGDVALLAATNRRTATRLLWAAVADAGVETTIRHVTAANQWALDVGLAAGLALAQDGYLALRQLRPPAPYLHHGAFL